MTSTDEANGCRMAGVKAVFVDLDDTLWWFSENTKTTLRHVYEAFGLAQWCDFARFDEVYERRNAELWDLYHYGKIERSYLLRERFEFTLRAIGADSAKVGEGFASLGEASDAMNEDYLHYLSGLPLLLPGAEDCLKYLRGRGYAVHVLSNGFKGVQMRKLRAGGIAQYIDELVLSDDCGITKPLPGIFDYALERAGASAAEVVMIGDNYDVDVLGAKQAGWRTVYFNWRGTEHSDGAPAADAVISQLKEIERIL